MLHDYGAGVVRTRLVAALDVAHALARELDLTTGLLPRDALWWARTAAGTRVAVWREPAVWAVRLRERPDAPPRRLRLPMPGLVFVCLPGRAGPLRLRRRAPAPALGRPALAACPCFNVFPIGPGLHRLAPLPGRPGADPRRLLRVPLLRHGRHGAGEVARAPRRRGPAVGGARRPARLPRGRPRARSSPWRTPSASASEPRTRPRPDTPHPTARPEWEAPPWVQRHRNASAARTSPRGRPRAAGGGLPRRPPRPAPPAGIAYDYVLGGRRALRRRREPPPARARPASPAAPCAGCRRSTPRAPSRTAGCRWRCGTRSSRPPRGRTRAGPRGAPGRPPRARRRLPPGVPPAGRRAPTGWCTGASRTPCWRSTRTGPSPACFSPRDDADEQRLGLYGVLGRLDAPRPEVRLRAGAYGYFLPLPWEAVFAGDRRRPRPLPRRRRRAARPARPARAGGAARGATRRVRRAPARGGAEDAVPA